MDLRHAVSRTVCYADYFHFPLYPEEIFHWLVCSRPVAFERLKSFLPEKISKSGRLLRSKTTYYSEQKILHARKMVRLLNHFPGLRMVALTGSVAANNSGKDDDIDLMFITDPHVLWLVRPIVIILMTLFFRRRYPQEDHAHAPNAFCPNLWLDSFALVIPSSKQSLYTAHEVLQIIPLLDREGTYRRFIQANSWTKKYLANAYTSLTNPNNRHSGPGPGIHPHTIPIRQLSSVICKLFLAPLNYLFYLIQLLYMSPKKTTETVHLHAAFLHTADFSSKLDSYLKTK